MKTNIAVIWSKKEEKESLYGLGVDFSHLIVYFTDI